MKTAEPHSRKNEAGKFETVGRTFRTIKVSRASDIDLSMFVKGDRVQVWGKEVTETREHDGKKYYDLIVWADRVERVGEATTAPSAPEPARSDPWPVAEIPDNPWPDTESVPF